MQLSGVAPLLFVRKSDDRDETLDSLNQKISNISKEFIQQAATLKCIEVDVQWKKATDYKAVHVQLTDIKAVLVDLAQRLATISGIDRQKPEVIPDIIVRAKRLEIELACSLKTIKALQKICDSEKLRTLEVPVAELNVQQEVIEEVEGSKGYNALYSFWKSVPYAMQAAYSSPKVLGGAWYEATGKLGTQLEEQVGQRLGVILQELEDRLVDFCKWDLDVSAYQYRIEKLYAQFESLYGQVNGLSQDALTPILHDYAYGLDFAFKEATRKLENIKKCANNSALGVLKAMRTQAEQYKGQQALENELERATGLYSIVQDMIDAEAARPECPSKSFIDKFVCGTLDLLGEVHASVDPLLLALNPQEALVVDRLLESDLPPLKDPVLSYLAKSMVIALHFPKRELVHVELDLALYLCADKPALLNGGEVFAKIRDRYEEAFSGKRTYKVDDLAQAVGVARYIVQTKNSDKDLLGYAKLWQLFLEFSEKIKNSELSNMLLARIEAVAAKHGYSTIERHVQKESLENILGLVLEPSARDESRQIQQQLIFDSCVMRLVATSFFSVDQVCQKQSQKQLERIFEDVLFENFLIGLGEDVMHLLYKHSLYKVVSGARGSVGFREERYLLEGPIDAFINSQEHSLEMVDTQMALYKLCKKERLQPGSKPLAQQLIARFGMAAFTKWYAGYDDLYITYEHINMHNEACVPGVYQDEVVRAISSESQCTDFACAREDIAVWDAVMAGDFGDDEQMAGIALMLQNYLIKQVEPILQSKVRNIQLELLLYRVRTLPAGRPSPYDLSRANWQLSCSINNYDSIFEEARCDALLKQAVDVLQHILQAAKDPQDIFAYAKGWQMSIEFARDPGFKALDEEQHRMLAVLLYSKLDALIKIPSYIPLVGVSRYCSITPNQLVVDRNDESALLRLIACALYGSDQGEKGLAQACVTKILELEDLSALSEQMMRLIFENTMDKLIKGVFEVGKNEKQLFFEGPAKALLKRDDVLFADCKVQHALYFMMIQEQGINQAARPFTALFLQLKGKSLLDQWVKQYQLFLGSR